MGCLAVATLDWCSGAGADRSRPPADPPELRQVVGVRPDGDGSLLVAVGRVHGAAAGQSIGENMAASREVAFGPVRDRF